MAFRPGYGPMLRTPGARAFSAAALVGRMPIAMLGIGTVLLVQDRRGSYALAGLVSAAAALGMAVIAPLVSRLVDRRGQRQVLPWAVLVSATGVLGLLVLAGSGAPAWTLLPFAAVMSTSSSQLGSCVRARWALVLEPGSATLQRAFAWESVVDEVVFVLGPPLVVLAAVLDPAVGLVGALGLTAAGTAWFVGQHDTQPPVHAVTARHPAALRSAGLRVLVAAMVCVGLVFGTMEVSMVAFADERGRAALAGPLLALIALGSALAGLAYGAAPQRGPLPRRFRLALVFLVVGLLPMVLATSVPAMVPAALLAGLAISPTLISAYGLVEVLVPAAARTEGYSWLSTGVGVGVAAGFAVSGGVAEAFGAHRALLVSLAGAVLACAVGTLGRRALATLPPAAGPAPEAAAEPAVSAVPPAVPGVPAPHVLPDRAPPARVGPPVEP